MLKAITIEYKHIIEMRITTWFAIIFIFIIPQMGIGQSAADSDPEARKLLDKMKSEYDSYETMEVEFDLTLDLPEQQAEQQKGKAVQSGQKFYLELRDQAIYCDGETVWVHLKDNNEVQINDVEENSSEEGFLTPQDMMRIYESGDYFYAITNSYREKGQQFKQIEFKPLDDDSEYRKIRLTVNTEKNKMAKMEIFSKDSSTYTLKVRSIKQNVKYGEETFAFNAAKFPGIHVEDLRF